MFIGSLCIRAVVLRLASLSVLSLLPFTLALTTQAQSKSSARSVKSGKNIVNKRAPAKQRRRDGKDDADTQAKFEISAPPATPAASMDANLAYLPQIRPTEKEKNQLDIERELPEAKAKKPLPDAPEIANIPAEQPSIVLSPTPSVSFAGLDFSTWGAGWPPDTVGDVGPNHYIQAVNTSIGIYNKTGTQLAAMTFNTLWTGATTGTLCDPASPTNHRGDPTVIYDPQYNRWIVADFAFTGTGSTVPFYECIAVSKTSDPVAGGWWLYAIRADDASHPWLHDYPKMSTWHDAIYMSANMFQGITFRGVRLWAFRLTDLINGLPVATRIVDTGVTTYDSMLPVNYRGLLPQGGDAFFISESATLFAFEVFRFHVDFVGAGSTFTGPTNVSQTSYSLATTTVTSPANALDSLRERLMMQAQYRTVGGVESIWVNHTVRTGVAPAPVGIQWAQINVTGGTIVTTPVQQQIYGNLSGDTVHRWMGSMAVDRQGNMALAYSASNAATNPGIRYNGRLITDPLNTLPQGEAVIQAGGGSQSGNCGGGPCQRWGDYSAMSVDPIDQCTFWYTTEYFPATGLNWNTRIAAFKFPGCLAPTAAPVGISGRVSGIGGRGLSNVFVTLTSTEGTSWTARTNNFGNFRFESIPSGATYILAAKAKGVTFANNPRPINVNDDLFDVDFIASGGSKPE